MLHTHLFSGPLSGTTLVSRRYQEGKTNLDFTEAPRSRQTCQHPTTQFFYRPDALPAAQPTASKHWRLKILYVNMNKIRTVSDIYITCGGLVCAARVCCMKIRHDGVFSSTSTPSWPAYDRTSLNRSAIVFLTLSNVLVTNIHTYAHLTALFPGLPGSASCRMVSASAGSYAGLHLAPDR